ncbi:MAG: hypothetical protein IT161_06870 [Bryobacterales bacterium]|nr:hypothetical protein [Bryobacterales bacterium]
MTKVQARYRLTRPLDETLLEAVAGAHGIYGLQRIVLAGAGDAMTVEYDASRLTLKDVDNRLRGLGLPAVRV